jgi:hypothetical protein
MTNFRMAMTAMAIAAAMAGSPALAADGSLAPGKPAGVHEAQRSPNLLLIAGAATIAVIAIVIATQSSSNAGCSSTNCPTANVTPSTST